MTLAFLTFAPLTLAPLTLLPLTLGAPTHLQHDGVERVVRRHARD